jgi:2-iminobutanoate/2-iminopropanoate deaminase
MSNKEVIRTNNAPLPVGPYNQAIAVPTINQKIIFCAGQIPIDPATGKMISGDISEQTERVLQNIQGLLGAAGADFAHVVKTTVFLADMDDFGAMNVVYAKYFTDPAPARSCVQVARLPLNAAVEIECIAAVPAFLT